jgi:hypothetical protein
MGLCAGAYAHHLTADPLRKEARMETPNATSANAALWAHYINAQYGRWLAPFGGVLASGLIGIGLANLYAAIYGDFVNRLFATNARQVTDFAQKSGADVLPRWTAVPLPAVANDTLPPWLRVARHEAADEQRTREQSSTLVGAAM